MDPAPPWIALVCAVLAFAFALVFTEYAGDPEKLARRMETFVMTADHWSPREREHRMRRLFDEYDSIHAIAPWSWEPRVTVACNDM